jgi:hypothetical protein
MIPQTEIAIGKVGFAVSELVPVGDDPEAHSVATGPTDQLLVRLGPNEAADVIDAEGAGMAWTFDVVMAAPGNAGMKYTITPDFAPDGVFDTAVLDIFKVSGPAQCYVGAADDETPSNLSGISGISQAYGMLKQSTDHWCVTAVANLDPSKYGSYENTATVTASGPEGEPVSDTDTWRATILPDPADELADGGLKVTHEVTSPQE